MGEPATEIPTELTEEELFIERRDAIAEKLKDDETFRKCIAELYIFQSTMDQAIRTFSQSGGIANIAKMMFKKTPKE